MTIDLTDLAAQIAAAAPAQARAAARRQAACAFLLARYPAWLESGPDSVAGDPLPGGPLRFVALPPRSPERPQEPSPALREPAAFGTLGLVTRTLRPAPARGFPAAVLAFAAARYTLASPREPPATHLVYVPPGPATRPAALARRRAPALLDWLGALEQPVRARLVLLAPSLLPPPAVLAQVPAAWATGLTAQLQAGLTERLVPIAYASAPRSRWVARALAGMAPVPPALVGPLATVPDQALFAALLPPGTRSPLLPLALPGAPPAVAALVAQFGCCYLHTGREIARLLVPLEIVTPEVLSRVHTLVAHEIQEGGGYPWVLTEATLALRAGAAAPDAVAAHLAAAGVSTAPAARVRAWQRKLAILAHGRRDAE